jgi:threonine/homoserine/homoserine lactone efflux protein
MDSRFVAFVAVTALLIIIPGPDMALVTRSAIRVGRRGASATAFGVGIGSVAWGLASALGVAVLLERSALAFMTLKLIGAAYLVWLGVRALLTHAESGSSQDGDSGRTAVEQTRVSASFLQGVIGNLLNPKAGVIFVTVFPQFIRAGDSPWRGVLMLIAYEVMILAWLHLYGSLIARSARGATARWARALINRIAGVVLIGLGARVALETR